LDFLNFIDLLKVKNKCLLSKWLFKLLNEEGVWQELLRNKYLHSKSLAQVTMKPTNLFRNWLKVILKEDLIQIRVGVRCDMGTLEYQK
jgi:hypothetical protein